MKIIQQRTFGKRGGKLPFAIELDLFGMQASCCVSDGMALQVMESDADTPIEKAGCIIGPGFKAFGRQ